MEINKKCQVFTPASVVERLLDAVGYKQDIFGKKVAENSCGDGNILIEIARRYIQDGLNKNVSLELIKAGLERDIYGAEIDICHINNCIRKLNELADEYNIKDVKWNIFNGDFLKQNIYEEFRYVIGNPPYITYLHMDLEQRNFLREKFAVCKYGKFDLCYAFIEASINSLSRDGKMAYLIPCNIFKNHFAIELRKMMLKGIVDVYDFTKQKLFEDKLTTSAIIVYGAGNESENIWYHDVVANKKEKINKSLLGDKWRFTRNDIKTVKSGVCFGDMFHTACSIATLLNKVFIISSFDDTGDRIKTGEFEIEKELVRKAVSPRSLNYKKAEYVIFPYYYFNGKLMRYTNEEFEKKYPLGAIYLKHYKEELLSRDRDNGILWFEYGRSQALSHLNRPKLLISTLITSSVRTYRLDSDTIPTSGLYITQKNEYSLDIAEEILGSSEFLDYVKSIGIVSNGSSFRISPRDINNFTVESKWITKSLPICAL